MRYIEKADAEPHCMAAWKQARLRAGKSLDYADFDKKEELNDFLRKEQHHICCYCQQQITHYQKGQTGGSHNEHLIPQNGDYGSKSDQMNYHNIYACCIDSRGLKKKEKNKRHCGDSKEAGIIVNFIQNNDCGEHFKYNVLGEITPNGAYDTWAEYESNYSLLPVSQQDAFYTIQCLNLNCNYLREDRMGDFGVLLPRLIKMSKEEVEQEMKLLEEDRCYVRYIDMLLYYMKQK